MFNTSGINRESPGRTVNDRRGTGNNRDGTGQNRDGTVASQGPIQTPSELRQRPVFRRWSPGEFRQSPGIAMALCQDATDIHRGPAWALPATTGVKPGRCRSSAGV
ncbi:hypothetical protein DPMN_053387 [Dreissena polymorpha]|uniref:Uncharacterized protein n=1 Tax=Dreissena polymorpha TaxID=45954 RepID=A0A9D4HNS9_DREPO|nr:hypothetical protein DPMN_053387 [Dreissena polymorpha]